MRQTAKNLLLLALAAVPPSSAMADDDGPTTQNLSGPIFELEGGAAFRGGHAKTMNGGASFGGGGQMRALKFDDAELIRAKLGYRWLSGLDIFLTYDRISGDVEWQVDFPVLGAFGVPFAGEAMSQMLLVNVGISRKLTADTIVRAAIGVGVSFNSIENTLEGQPAYAWLGTDREASFAARGTLGLMHNITDHVAFALNSTFDYYGQFRTADERVIGAAVESIVPYEFEAWGGTVSAALSLRF